MAGTSDVTDRDSYGQLAFILPGFGGFLLFTFSSAITAYGSPTYIHHLIVVFYVVLG
jgi:hypothetical protein